MLHNHGAVNSSIQTTRYCVGIGFAAPEGGETHGRCTEEQVLLLLQEWMDRMSQTI
jgi:hypothetical protein